METAVHDRDLLVPVGHGLLDRLLSHRVAATDELGVAAGVELARDQNLAEQQHAQRGEVARDEALDASLEDGRERAGAVGRDVVGQDIELGHRDEPHEAADQLGRELALRARVRLLLE